MEISNRYSSNQQEDPEKEELSALNQTFDPMKLCQEAMKYIDEFDDGYRFSLFPIDQFESDYNMVRSSNYASISSDKIVDMHTIL